MKKLIGTVLLASTFFAAAVLAQTPSAPKCRVAEVNPVTNHALCIDPVGGVLDPQAQKPCRGMRQTGQWTLSNGCDAAPAGTTN